MHLLNLSVGSGFACEGLLVCEACCPSQAASPGSLAIQGEFLAVVPARKRRCRLGKHQGMLGVMPDGTEQHAQHIGRLAGSRCPYRVRLLEADGRPNLRLGDTSGRVGYLVEPMEGIHGHQWPETYS